MADHVACFEATHGTAPKYAGKNVVNPGSLLFSGVMMLEYIGWKEAAQVISDAYEKKYGRRPRNENVAEAYLFRLGAR